MKIAIDRCKHGQLAKDCVICDLEQQLAAKDAEYRKLLRWFCREYEDECDEYIYTAEIRSREDSIEKAINKELAR